MNGALRRLAGATALAGAVVALCAASASAQSLPQVERSVAIPGGVIASEPLTVALAPDAAQVFVGSTAASARVQAFSADGALAAGRSLDLGANWPAIVALGATTIKPPDYGVWAVGATAPIRIAAIDPLRMTRKSADVVVSDTYGAAVHAVFTPPSATAQSPRVFITTDSTPVSIVAVDLVKGVVVDVGNLDLGRQADAVAISPDGKRLLVAQTGVPGETRRAIVTVFDTRNLAPVGDDITLSYDIWSGQPVAGVAVGGDGSRAYVASGNRYGLATLDLTAGTVIDEKVEEVDAHLVPGGLAASAAGDELLYLGSRSGSSQTLTRVGTASLAPISASPAAAGYNGALVVSPTGTDAYVAVRTSESAGELRRFRAAPAPRQLTAAIAGRGGGVIQAAPGGLLCGAGLDCRATYRGDIAVQLVAIPNPGAVFTGWSGACTGSDDDCTVTMDAARSVTATFAPAPTGMRAVTTAVVGKGRVESSLGGAACAATCTTMAWLGTEVALTAVADSGSRFAYWDGACTGTVPTCTIAVDQARLATAVFEAIPGPTPVPPAPSPLVTPVPGPNPPGPVDADAAGAPLVLSGLSLSRAVVRPGQGSEIRYRLSRSARVRMTFVHAKTKGLKYVYTIAKGKAGADAGLNRVYISGRVKGRAVRAGAWKMTVEAIGENGTRSVVTRTVTVRGGS